MLWLDNNGNVALFLFRFSIIAPNKIENQGQ